MISQKYRNAVQKAWEVQGMRGTSQKQRQHVVIRLDITLRLLQKYHKPAHRETGTHIKYAQDQLRLQPDKLPKMVQAKTWTPRNYNTRKTRANRKHAN